MRRNSSFQNRIGFVLLLAVVSLGIFLHLNSTCLGSNVRLALGTDVVTSIQWDWPPAFGSVSLWTSGWLWVLNDIVGLEGGIGVADLKTMRLMSPFHYYLAASFLPLRAQEYALGVRFGFVHAPEIAWVSPFIGGVVSRTWSEAGGVSLSLGGQEMSPSNWAIWLSVCTYWSWSFFAPPSPEPAQPTNRVNLAEGLIAWWRFDEISGTGVVDSSSNRNNGTVYGAQRVTGVFGGALRFDGVNDYVEVPSSDTLNLSGSFTIAAWILSEGLAGYPCDIILNKEGDVVGQRIPYEVAVLGTSCPGYQGYFGWHLSVPGIDTDAPNVGAGWHEGGGPIPTGRWVPLALVYDGVHIRTYIDGTLRRSFSATGSVIQNDRAVRIAARGAPEPAHDFFKGYIDEVRIYNRPLSADEVRALANPASPTSLPSPTSSSSPTPTPSSPPVPASSGGITSQSVWLLILGGVLAMVLALLLIRALGTS